jgi:hypothetical protein
MSILCRTFVASLLMCALAPGANCASNSTANEDVIALRETVIALAGDRDLRSALDSFAVSLDSCREFVTVYGVVAEELQSDPKAPQTGFAAGLRRSVEKHAPEWKAAYEAGRASGC